MLDSVFALIVGAGVAIAAAIGVAGLIGVPTVIAYILVAVSFRLVILPLTVGKQRERMTAEQASALALSDIGLIVWLLVVFL